MRYKFLKGAILVQVKTEIHLYCEIILLQLSSVRKIRENDVKNGNGIYGIPLEKSKRRISRLVSQSRKLNLRLSD